MSPTATFVDGLRPEIRNLPAYNSGLSAAYVRARYGVEHIAKLGSNENPWGASPKVVEAIMRAACSAAIYPDPSSSELRGVLAAKLNVAPDCLTFGNGSEDLIAVCAHSFLGPGDEMLTMLPSFGLHGIYGQAIGAKVRTVTVGPDFRLDIAEMITAMTPATRVVMFSSPSNPTGTAIHANDLRLLLAALGQGVLLVFDEAYFEYAAAEPGYPDCLGILQESTASWILLRTFSKAWGLAGLRVGYGIASDPSLIQVIDRARTPFNVNLVAQAAAVAALEDTAWMRECVLRTVAERERVRTALVEMGYDCSPSIANFAFFDAREDASALAERLLRYGVIVKPWREPGFTRFIRVSTGTPEANDQFLRALAETADPH